MHILLLPSLYPSRENPNAGIFIKEQGRALSEMDDVQISVLNWGPNEFVLKFRNPWASLRSYVRYQKAQTSVSEYSKTFREAFVPQISWTSLINRGNYDDFIHEAQNIYRGLEKRYGRFNLIHAHMTFPAGYIALRLSDSFLTPFVITEHSGPFPIPKHLNKHGELKTILSKPLMSAKQVLCVSEWLKKQVEEYRADSLSVIPNMVNTDYFVPAPAIVQSPDTKKVRIFTTTAMNESKGTTDMLSALYLLKNQHDFQLRILGFGSKLKKYQKLAEHMQLKNIVWLDEMNREQYVQELQKCDFYLMPSRLEAFSMVMIEAMACGKPVLATACGGPEEIMNPECGLMVPPENPQAMAEGINKMISTYQNYSSSKIREQILQKYSHKEISKDIYSIYSKFAKV